MEHVDAILWHKVGLADFKGIHSIISRLRRQLVVRTNLLISQKMKLKFPQNWVSSIPSIDSLACTIRQRQSNTMRFVAQLQTTLNLNLLRIRHISNDIKPQLMYQVHELGLSNSIIFSQ